MCEGRGGEGSDWKGIGKEKAGVGIGKEMKRDVRKGCGMKNNKKGRQVVEREKRGRLQSS